jgi:hypothetical protein
MFANDRSTATTEQPCEPGQSWIQLPLKNIVEENLQN